MEIDEDKIAALLLLLRARKSTRTIYRHCYCCCEPKSLHHKDAPLKVLPRIVPAQCAGFPRFEISFQPPLAWWLQSPKLKMAPGPPTRGDRGEVAAVVAAGENIAMTQPMEINI